MELRDGELVIGGWVPDDAPAVHAACQDAEIQRWIPRMPRPYTLEHARAFVGASDGFAIREHGEVVGSIALRLMADDTASVGYWCAPQARGRGIMTRALRRVCRHALDELAVQRLELTADRDNLASLRVAENVGFRREGVMRSKHAHPDGHRIDSVLLSLLPGELVEDRVGD
jgi:RimJ/RimL family protein N-acetyltransferase